MNKGFIPFRETHYFSDLICDYLDENSKVKPFYHRFPKIENFKAQIEEKQTNYSQTHRKVLYTALEKQYKNCPTSERTQQNIKALRESTTFTVTTGHQLNIFTGPLYFLYKIIATINLCKTLKSSYPGYNFVPVYWMATEDHDFEEINFFNFKGKKLAWNTHVSGAVGRLDTQGLEDVFEVFSKELDHSKNSDTIRNLFQNAYLQHDTLATATRALVNELFGKYGLVILDADTIELKKTFIPFVKNDILNNTAFHTVSETNTGLENYKLQVNPREINLFYLTNNKRERIEASNNRYSVVNTNLTFTKNEIENEIEQHPERFSPNVILRPLYQEVILPNLCYIGGGGEIAYWLQLKHFFNSQKVTFPILLLRNSVLLIAHKQAEKLQKLKISHRDLFLKKDAFINKKVREISNLEIDFSPQKEHLKQQFEHLYHLAQQTDKSFYGAVKAQEVKQLKGLEKLEKRLLKAQKRKLADEVTRMVEIQNQLFPNQSLQERTMNFSEFYVQYGETLIKTLMENIKPLDANFLILEE